MTNVLINNTDGLLVYGLAGRDVHLAISYDPSVLLGAKAATSSKPGSDSDDPQDLEKMFLIEQRIYKLVFFQNLWNGWNGVICTAPPSPQKIIQPIPNVLRPWRCPGPGASGSGSQRTNAILTSLARTQSQHLVSPGVWIHVD